MVIQKTPTKIDKIVSLQIGQHQENVATQIKMDVSDWITVHPAAGFHVLFKRPGEVLAQPVLSSLEEGILTWTVGNWETGLTGVGYLEVRAIEAESALVAKSRVIPCSVEDSIIEDGEVPPEFTGWVNTVLAAKDAVDETYADTLEAIGEIYETTASASAGEVTLRVTADIPANTDVLFAVISTGNANLTGNLDYTWTGASSGGNRHARITASNVFVHYHRQIVSTGVTSASVTLNVGGSGSVRFAVATGAKIDHLMDDLRVRQTQVYASNAAASANAAAGSATAAGASETAAGASAGNAAASEANAEHYADLAQTAVTASQAARDTAINTVGLQYEDTKTVSTGTVVGFEVDSELPNPASATFALIATGSVKLTQAIARYATTIVGPEGEELVWAEQDPVTIDSKEAWSAEYSAGGAVKVGVSVSYTGTGTIRFVVATGMKAVEVNAEVAQANAAASASSASASATAAEAARDAAIAAKDDAETTVDGAIDSIQAEGATQVGNVNTAGTTQVGNVNTAGTTQVNAVQAKGTEVLNSIPSDYSTLSSDVGNLKSAITELVDYNDFEIIKPISKNNRTISGVSWAWDGDSCTVTGEAPTTTNSVYDIYNASYPVAGQQGTTFPMGVNPGGSYYLKISSTATPTKVHFRAMYSTGGSYITAINSSKDGEFSIPSDAVRCVIRIYVDQSSGTISETVTVKLFPKILALETKDKTFVGAINENNNALNAICGIEYSSGTSPVARKDYTSGSLILVYFNNTNQCTLFETTTAVSKGTALSSSTNIRAVAQNCDNVAGWLKDYVDGRTITSIVQTETSSQDEGNNVLTITLSNGAQATLTVRNGSKGSTGAQGAQGAQGLQGNSGYTGAAGELEVVNNLTDGGATSALSAEMGKTLNQKTSLLTGSTIINILDNGARRDEDISQTLYTIMHGLDDNPTGAVIYIPRGTYYMSFPIYWKSRVSLIGDGMGQTIIKPTRGTTPFRGDNLSDFVFDGFTIDGELTTKGKGIFHRFLSNVIYRNLEIKNTCESGLGCDHFSNCVIENVWCDNCGRTGDLSAGTAYGCSGLGIGTGLFNQGVEALTVSNCHANNCRQYGIFFERQNETGYTSDIPVGTSVIGCTASGNRFGFGACGCDNLVFVGCTAYKNKAAGFSVDHGTLSGNEHTGTRVKFIGCVAKANGDGTTSGYPEYDNIPIGNGFVAIKSTKGMEMIGCCALENTNDGVYIGAGSSDISIIGGGFDYNGANGIHFASGGYTQRIRIAPSFVRNNTAVGILNESSLHYGTIKDAVVAYNDIGIKSTTTVSDVYVKDNFVYSNTTSNFDGVVQG